MSKCITIALALREAEAWPARNRVQAAAALAALVTRRLWRGFWDYQARRATMMILRALDDRALADIGLRRSDIDQAVFGSCVFPRSFGGQDWRSSLFDGRPQRSRRRDG